MYVRHVSHSYYLCEKVMRVINCHRVTSGRETSCTENYRVTLEDKSDDNVSGQESESN